MSRICKECGDLFSGRSDKKFCCDQCRNTYNNRLNCDNSSLVRNTNRILRSNRKILHLLNPGEKAVVSRERLLRSGFRFNYMTGLYRTGEGDTCYYCYDQGYVNSGGEYYTLIKRNDLVT